MFFFLFRSWWENGGILIFQVRVMVYFWLLFLKAVNDNIPSINSLTLWGSSWTHQSNWSIDCCLGGKMRAMIQIKANKEIMLLFFFNIFLCHWLLLKSTYRVYWPPKRRWNTKFKWHLFPLKKFWNILLRMCGLEEDYWKMEIWRTAMVKDVANVESINSMMHSVPC